MSTKTIDVSKAQGNLKELVALVYEGTEVIFTDNSKPIARLLPIVKSEIQRIAGLHSGAIWTSDDFDELLDDEFWTGKE